MKSDRSAQGGKQGKFDPAFWLGLIPVIADHGRPDGSDGPHVAKGMHLEQLESRYMLASAVDPLAQDWRGFASTIAAQTASQAPTLIAVDGALHDQGLDRDLTGPGRKILVLRSGSDPLAQITAALSSMKNVRVVHILSHGQSGALNLGGTVTDAAALTRDAGLLARWSASMTKDAFVALYGCDVAEGSSGQAFVRALAKRTGVAVAASTDLTGAAIRGGDWSLEFTAGDRAVPIEPLNIADFDGVLALTITASGGGVTHLVGSGATVVDGSMTIAGTPATLSSATVRISSGFRTGEDVLALPSPPSGFTASFNATNGTLTLSTASAQTLAQYQAAMRLVTYTNTQTPFAHLDARSIVFEAGGYTSSVKTVTPQLPIDSAIKQSIKDALQAIDKIGQKISAVGGTSFSGNTTDVPLVGKTITELLYPNSPNLDSSGNPVADTAHWSRPSQVGDYLQLYTTASSYLDGAGNITNLDGLKAALEAKLATIVQGTSPLMTVDVGFTTPADTDDRQIAITIAIRTANGGTMQLILSELERDLGLKFPTPPTVDAGGGADVKVQIDLDLTSHTYGGATPPAINANNVTIDFNRLNALAGTIFNNLNATVEIGAIRGSVAGASGMIAALFPVNLGGSNSRTLASWTTYANGASSPSFGTIAGGAEMTLPISASIGGVSATTANTKVVVTDGNLFDTQGFTYTTTDFGKLTYFSGVKVEDIIQQVLKVGDLYQTLDGSNSDLLGVRVPFVKNTTMGDVLDFKSLFDSAIGQKINVYEPVLNTPGRDQLTDYRLPLSSDSTPQPSMYSDLRAGFSFGVVVNDSWPIHTVTIAADGTRATLDNLISDVNTALVAAGVQIVASNRSNKMVLKASDVAVQRFAVVPVAPASGLLNPTTPPADLSAIALNTPQYYTVTGSTTGSITGTNYYTVGSTLAKAAVHAGLLTDGQTGIVKVTRVGATGALWDSTRNGVSSSSAGSSSNAYLIESAASDLRRLGLVGYDSQLSVLETVSNGAARGTLPLQADLPYAGQIVIKNGSSSYTVSVADNNRTSLTDTVADVQAGLVAAGISATNLSARLVDAAGNALATAPVNGTNYSLQFYLPTGSTWTDFTLAPTGDATAYRVLPFGFLSGDVSAQPRPEALRTFEDLSSSTIFPGLSMTPVYDAVNNTVTVQFSASASANPTLAAAFDLDLAPLGKISLGNASLTFSPVVSKQLAFGLEFKIGPSSPVSVASGQAVPSNGRLSGDANFSLDMVLQDRYDVTVPHAWTTGNQNIQDLVGDINRALKQTSALSGGTVDLTADRMVARRSVTGTQFELINATPVGSPIAVTQTNGVLSSDLAIAFQENGKHYVLKLAAADTTTNSSFADLVADLNTALSTTVVDANGNSIADDDETKVASLSANFFFTTISNTSGGNSGAVSLFSTSPAGENWPATITLSATRTNPAVSQLGFDDSGSDASSVVTVRAPGASAKIRNAANGDPIAGGSVGINLPSFAGSVPYGFNTLNFSGTTLGSVTSRAQLRLGADADATVNDIGSNPASYLDRTLTGGNGTGKARAGFTLTGITAASGAAIVSNATIQIAITDIANDTVIVDKPIGVPIPLQGTNHGKLAVSTTINFLSDGAQYSVLVSKPATMANTTFAQLAAQFDAALSDVTRTVGGVTTNHFDASALFSITQNGDAADLQVNQKAPTANPDYADVIFQPGLSAFGEVGLQGSFGIATVADAMQDVLPALDSLQSGLGLLSEFKLPLINTPVNELIDIKGDLLTRIDSLRGMTVAAPDQIAAAVASALSVPSQYVKVTFDGANNAYRVDFQFETGAALAKPLDMSLADFYKFADGQAPAGLTSFNDRGSSSPLAVKIKAITTVSLGIDLTDPQNPRSFLYGHDGSDDRILTDGSANGTSVELQIQASANDINFTASLGAFGIFVKQGTATLGGPAITTPDDEPYYTFDDETKQLHFARQSDAAVMAITLGDQGAKYYLDGGDASDVGNYHTSFQGTVEANLPIFTPTEFINPFTNRTVDVRVQGQGAVQSVTPGGNIFNLQIADLGAFADDSLKLSSLQSQIASIYTNSGGTLSGADQTQVDSLQSQVDAMRTSGDVEIFTPDVDDANSGVKPPTVLDLLRDPAILVDGIDVVMGTVESGLRGLDNLNIPVIGPALGSAVDSVFNWRSTWLLDLKHELRGRGEAIFQSIKSEVYEFLGPDGLNLLLKDNGIRSVDGMVPADNPDDVELDFLDGDGKKLTGMGGYGAQAMEFKVRLGSVLVDTGKDISFDFNALAPAFQLGIDGGLTFKLGWDMTIGFGISLTDGFYLTTDSDPSANELELRFEAGLSGRQTGFNVAARSGSISGYSIVDAAGAWVYGPKKGDGSSQILDVMPVDENGNNYDLGLGAPPLPNECAMVVAAGQAQPAFWVVAVSDGNGHAVPAQLDQLGQYRAQTSRDPDKVVEFNQTAPFSAYGSLFAFNLTAVDQIKTGLHPLGDADYYYNPADASAITSDGRNDLDAGVNRNNSLPTRIAGRIGVNFLDPSAASKDYVARPGPTSTGFMLMDGANALGGEPVLDDAGEFTPVRMIGGSWYVMAPQDPNDPSSLLVQDHLITEDESKNRITFSEIREAGLKIFELKLNAEAIINLGLTLSIGDNANIPKLTASLNLDWRTDSMKPPSNPFATDEEQQRDLVPEVGVNNIRLDLGSFLTKFIKPIATKIDGALDPLDPLIDVLQTKLPVISDIAGRPIRFTNLLTTFGGPEGQAVATVIDMAILVRQLSGVMAAVPDDVNVYLPIGNFWLAKVGAGPLGRPGLGTQIYYDNNEVTAPSITQRNQSMIANGASALNSVTDALGGLDALDQGSSSQPGVDGEDRGGFNLPILQDPITIFKLIMGQDVPLVTFSLPKLDFSFNQDIPLVKVLIFEVGLRIGLQMHGQLAMGYDTRGLREFKESHDAEDLLDGFYISDRANADGSGADVDEFTLHANIALYGGVDLYLAKGGIEGGLNFDAKINLNDPDNDGKLRVMEAVDLVQQTGNPLDLADLAFSGEVYARYYYWAGLKIWTPWKTYTVTLFEGGDTFARAQIFSFTRDGSDGPPILAAKVTTTDQDGTEHPSSLMLNMGPNSIKRVSNQDPLKEKDGAESMKVWNDSPGSGTVHVQYLNYSGSYTKTFTGISRVVAYGGDGNDTIDASGLQGLPVEIDGGAGNDTITLGSGSASADSTIKGGAGNDTITVAGGGKVRLDGEEGNDVISAGTGISDIDGGSGNDTITGGGSGSTNTVNSRRQFGVDRLILNPLAMINLLNFIDSTLPATANLQGASSTIYAGDTNGTLFDAAAVTEIRGSTGADTFNIINPTTRLANGGRGLVLRGGPGNDTYNVTADDVSGLSGDGITIDDGIYRTAAAAPGAVDIDSCGMIQDIKVATKGAGYVTPPEVLITDPTGSGARAVASLDKNGAISGIFMLAQGDGYTHPTVVFVDRVSRNDRINFKSASTGTFALTQDGNGADDYRVSLNNKSIKFVGWAQPGTVRPADYSIDEIDAVNFDLPNAALQLNDALDVTDLLTINAHRLTQNAPITADTVRITTDVGFSADYPINATNNGDVLIRVTGKNATSARKATASATVVGGVITAITVIDGGAGYDFVPTVTVVDARGTKARLRANISGGAITSITVLDGGEGYLSLPAPQITIANPSSIQLNTDLSSSTVDSDPGTGDGRGTVTLRAEVGAIDQSGDVFFPTGSKIEWQQGDYHYSATKSLDDITSAAYPATLGGQGATAVAVLDADGRVNHINVTNGGSGYSKNFLPVVLIDGIATATAIVSNSGAITGFHVTYPGEGYGIAPKITILPNGFGKIVGADAAATALNRDHIKSAGGSLVASAMDNIGDPSKPLKTDVENMVAETHASSAGIHVLDKDSVRIGMLDHINGLSTINGDISVTNFAGTIGLGAPVQQTDSAGNLLWQDAAKTVPIYARNEDGSILYQGGKLNAGTAQIKLTADDVDVNSFISASGGKLVLQPVKADAPIGLNGTRATATAVVTDGQITGFTDLWNGRGYSAEPLVTIQPPGERAFGVANILSGQVTSINVSYGGTRYSTDFPPTIAMLGGGVNGATPAHPATAIAHYTNGAVTSVEITDPGSGYISTPEVVIALPGQQALARAIVVNNRVTGFTITNPGSNYATAPDVVISQPFTFGSDAMEVSYFQDGFDDIIIGRAEGRHTFYSADASFTDGVTLRSPLGGSVQMERLQVDGPAVIVGSGHTTNLTSASPSVQGTYVEIDDNIVVHENVDATITATDDHVSIFGAAKGKIDGVANSTTENLTITDVGDVVVTGAIGSTYPIHDLVINSTGGGSISLQQSVNLEGDLHIVKGGAITIGGNVTIGGNLIIDDGASVTFNGTLNVAGNVTISKATTVSFAQNVNVTGFFKLGDVNDPSKLDSVTFASTARLDVSGVVEIYTSDSQAYGNRVGVSRQPVSMTLRSDIGDVTFQNSIAMPSTDLTIIKAHDVTFAAELTANTLTVNDASGQTRFQRATSLGSMVVVSTDLVQVQNRMDINSGDAAITSNQVDFAGGTQSVQFNGSGSSTLTIKPRTSSRAITLGSPPGSFTSLDLSDVDLAAIGDGFTDLVIGNSSAGTGTVTIGSIGSQQGVGNSLLLDATTIFGGAVNIVQPVDDAAQDGALKIVARTGDITVGGAINGTVTERNDLVTLQSLAGAINLNQPVYAGTELRLIAAGAVLEGAIGWVGAPSLSVSTGGAVTLLNGSNNVATVGINSANHAIAFRDDHNFTIGTVNGISGITSGSADTQLVNNGAIAIQTQPITASGLLLQGTSGVFTLTSSSNNIATLAGNTGTVNYHDTDAMTIGSVGGTNGLTVSGSATVIAGASLAITQPVTSTGGAITLQAVNGTLTSMASGDVSATGGAASLTASTSMTLAGDVTSTTHGVTLGASTNMQSTAPISAFGDVVITDNAALALAAVTSTHGAVSITSHDNFDANGAITAFGSASITSSHGSINLTGPGDVSAATAALLAYGAIVAAGDITSTSGNIGLTAGTSLSTTGAISSAANVTAQSTTATTFAGAIGAVGKVTAASGLTMTTTAAGDISAGGDVALTSHVDILASGDVKSTGGKVTLTADDDIATYGAINSGAATKLAAGDAIYTASPINSDAAVTIDAGTGDVTIASAGDITAAGDVTITGVGISSAGDITSTGGAVSLDSSASLSSAAPISGHGAVNVAADDIVTLSANVTSTDAATTVTAFDDLQSTGTISGKTAVNATSTTGVISTGPIAASGGNVAVTAAGTIDANGAISASGTVVMHSQYNKVNITPTALVSGSSVSLTADDSVVVDGPITSTTGDVNLDAGTLITTSADIVSAAAAIAHAATTIALDAKITATGAATLTSNTSTITATANGDVAGGAGVTMTAPGDIATSGTIDSSAGSVLIDSGADVSVEAAVTGHQNVTLTADGDIQTDATVTATLGDVTMTAGGKVQISSAVNSGDAVTVTAQNGTILVGSSAPVTAGGDVALNSTGNLSVLSDITSTDGNITLASSGGLIDALADFNSGGNTTMTAPGVITEGGSVTTGGNTSITSSGAAVAINGPIDAQGTTTVSAHGNLTSNAAGDIHGHGVVNLTATGGITTGGDVGSDAITTISAAGNVAATAPITGASGVSISSTAGAMSLVAVSSSNAGVTIEAENNIDLHGAIGAHGAAEITSDSGAINTFADGDISAASVAITAYEGIVLDGDVTSTTGDIKLDAGDDLTTNGMISSAGKLTATAAESISGSAAITAAGDINMEALAGSFETTAAADITSTAGDALLIAHTSMTLAGDVKTTAGNTTLTAGTDLSTNGVIASGGTLTATAGGLIAASAAITATGDIEMEATGGALSTTGAADITSSTGNISLTAGAAMTLAGDVTATLGTIEATASGDLVTTGVVLAHGNVTATSSDGAIAAGPITSQAGAVTVTAHSNIDVNAAISASGLATIDSRNGAVNITSSGSSSGGTVDLTADRAVVIAGAVTSTSGDVTIDAGTSINDTAAITSAGGVTATAASSIWDAAAITAQGAAALTAQHGAITSTIDGDISGASVALNAGADITTAGDLTSTTGAITINAGEDFDATGPITSAGALTATAHGSMSAAAAIHAVGNISMDAQGTSLGIGANADITSTAGSVTLHGHTTVQVLGDSTTATNVAATAGGNITFGAPVSAGGAVTATSTSGNVTANAAINASGNVSLDATAGAVNSNAAGDIKSTNGTTTLHSGATMSLPGDVTSQNSTVAITAGGNIVQTGNVSGKNGVAITSTGGTIAAATVASSNAGVAINGNGNVTLNGTVTSQTAINVGSAHGGITVSAPITSGSTTALNAQGGSVTTNPAGDISAAGSAYITASAAIALGGDVESDAAITITAGGNVDTTGVIHSGGALSISSGAGLSTAGAIIVGTDAYLNAAGAITINAPLSVTGNVSSHASDITTTAAGDTNAGGTITLSADDDLSISGDLNGGSVMLYSGDDVTLTAMTATGAIGVSSGGDVNATGTINTPGSVTLAAHGTLNLNADADITSGGIVTLGGDTGINTAADIYSSGDGMKFLSPTTLTGDVNLNTSRNGRGAVTFNSTLDGAFALTAWVARDLKFLGAVGQVGRLASIYVRNARVTTFVSAVAAGWVQQSGGTGPTTIMGVMNTTRSKGVSIRSAGISVTGSVLTRNVAPIMLDAGDSEVSLGAGSMVSSTGSVTINAATFTQKNSSKIYGGAGQDIVITADNITLSSTANSMNGSGRLVLQPISASRRIDLGRTGSEFELTSDELAGIAGGFKQVIIGRGHDGYDSGDEGSHTIVVGNAQFRSPVVIRSAGNAGDVSVVGNLTSIGAGSNITIVSGGNLTVNGSIGAQSTGNITLTADADGDHNGTVSVGEGANASIGAANGLILLKGMHVRIGSPTTAALIASPLNSVELRTTDSQSTVTVTNNQTNLAGHGLYIGAANSFHPASVTLQGSMTASDDLNIYTTGNATLSSFRLRAQDKVTVRANGDLKMSDGIVIAQDGSMQLVADADGNNKGAKTLNNVDTSEASSVDLQTTITAVNLPASMKPGQKGSATIHVTNLGTTAVDKYVTVLVYTSATNRLKAGNRVIGRSTFKVKLAAGKSADVGIDLQIPLLHASGNYRVIAELIPYGSSTSTGGSKDANISVSTQTFAIG